ncbi:MAG: acyl-CoA thioesterase [Fibrobacter sp.]|nr:acyl-CoA thioesterase [Fibrobacter sp.]
MAIAFEENPKAMKFTKSFKVTPEMIDDNKHFNNVWSVQWIQDIAIAHSEEKGGMALMRQLGAGWMIRTQHIEYKNQAFLDDEIIGTTWVDGMSKLASLRKSQFVRASDGKVIFESETTWVFMDMTRGRPMAIPAEMWAVYQENP